jgi:hypothetical protein
MKKKFPFHGFSLCLCLPIVLGCFLALPSSDFRPISNRRALLRPVIALNDSPRARQEKTAFGKTVKERPRPETILRAKASRETWARTYGDSYEDSVASIQKTDDGGIVIAGSSEYYATDWLRAALVLKVLPDGEIQWQYSFPSAEEAASIRQTSDGGFIVAGSTAMPDTEQGDLWLAKLDATGVMEWQTTYGGNQDDRAGSVWQTVDGGYLVVGTTESFGAGGKDIWILKLSPTGTVEWQRSYGGVTADTAECACPTADGGLIVAGSTIIEESKLNAMLVLKLNSGGDIDWQHRYRNSYDDGEDTASSILPTTDGGCIIIGKSRDAIILFKLSLGGAIEWQRIHLSLSYFEAVKNLIKAIKPTSDGGYVAVGTTPYFTTRGDEICVMKLSADGVIEWALAYGGERYDDIGLDIEQLEDGKYFVAGTTRSFGAGESDILILNIDAGGGIDKFPEIISNLHFDPYGHFYIDPYGPGGWLVAQNSNLRSHETTAGAGQLALDYGPAEKTGQLVFSPPYLSGHRKLNRSLSQAEYIDLLSWEENPNNSDLNIVNYRLYVLDPYYTARLVGEFPAGTRTYLVRNVPEYADRTYSLAGVTDKGDEGMRSYINIVKPKEN